MAYINVDEVYILDNTGLQVDMTTDLPFKDAGLTESQQAQARANIGAGGTNPNLLDNPFFTVNQRATVSTSTANAYIADRWKVSGNTYTWTYGRAALSVTNAANSLTYLIQPIETTLSDDLNGKSVTFSVKVSGTVYSTTFTWDKTARNSAITIPNLSDIFFWYGGNGEVCLRFTAGGTWTVNAVKLELGSVSTLANDAPPDYGTELAKCQRYFVRLQKSGSNDAPVGQGYSVNTTTARILIPLSVTMRTTPTVAYSGAVGLVENGALRTSVSAITQGELFPNGFWVSVAHTGLTQYAMAVLLIRSAATYIDLSADL